MNTDGATFRVVGVMNGDKHLSGPNHERVSHFKSRNQILSLLLVFAIRVFYGYKYSEISAFVMSYFPLLPLFFRAMHAGRPNYGLLPPN